MPQNPRWTLVPTPRAGELSLSVYVPQKTVGLNPLNIPKIPNDNPEAAPLFKELGLVPDPIPFNLGWIPDNALAADDRFGLYVFVDSGIQNDDVVFKYGLPKTKEEANTPFRSTWKKHGNHRWPPILKGIVLLEDNTFPRSANFISNGSQGLSTGATYYDRYIYVPDTNEGTRFKLYEYLSPFPFRIPHYRTPVATAVQYSVNGLNGSFPECLHDEITIPATRTSTATYLGGTAFTGNGSIEGQYFPRTNFKSWLPYVVYDEQEQQEDSGLWYRQKIKVYPPQLPRAIRR